MDTKCNNYNKNEQIKIKRQERITKTFIVTAKREIKNDKRGEDFYHFIYLFKKGWCN